jgi:hypothetical protein
MMGNYHVRFGGGRLKKGPQGHLVSRLPDTTDRAERSDHMNPGTKCSIA